MICAEINLPENFNVWYYYFQTPVTQRAKALISKKISNNLEYLQEEVLKRLKDTSVLDKDNKINLWDEEFSEANRKTKCSGKT